MNRRYAYQIVNVFAESPFGGNPLAVFPDASGLDDATMQAIARQFNLSETVFVFPSAKATARLRIFTPALELPFAGHPVIGCAAVLDRQSGVSRRITLETRGGVIDMGHEQDRYVFTAREASCREAGLDRSTAAAMLGLLPDDIAGNPVWVNAGNEQLLIRIATRAAVLRARPETERFLAHATLAPGRSTAYLWHADGAAAREATVRFFYAAKGGIAEDAGTGSALANLGGWCLANQMWPLNWRVTQGEVLDRPNHLYLDIDEQGVVSVGGKVVPVAEGQFYLA